MQRVLLHDLQPPVCRLFQTLQRGDGARIIFYGDDFFRPHHQKGAGQAAGAGADFKNRLSFKTACRARDFLRQVQVEQEILPKRFFRAKPVFADDIAQRRQGFQLRHGGR